MAIVNYTVFNSEIVEENRGGTLRDYVPDPLGSTRALLDGSQSITDTWNYWPYGEVITSSGTSPTPYKYGGVYGYRQGSADYVYVRTRTFDCKRGIWIMADPFWIVQSAYRYVRGNPTRSMDATGLWSVGYIGFTESEMDSLLNHFLNADPGYAAFMQCLRNCANTTWIGVGSNKDDVAETIDSWSANLSTLIKDVDFYVIKGTDRDCDSGDCSKRDVFNRNGKPVIIICPLAWRDKKCGELWCNLAHEMIHTTGESHKDDNNAVFECVNKIKGCEKWTARHAGR